MTNDQLLMDTDEASWVVRMRQRDTPAGKLLSEIGMDYYDTESCARRVAEHAATKLAAYDDMIALMRRVLEVAEDHPDEITEMVYALRGAIAKATGA